MGSSEDEALLPVKHWLERMMPSEQLYNKSPHVYKIGLTGCPGRCAAIDSACPHAYGSITVPPSTSNAVKEL